MAEREGARRGLGRGIVRVGRRKKGKNSPGTQTIFLTR